MPRAVRRLALVVLVALTGAACGDNATNAASRQGALDPAVEANLDAVFEDPGFLTRGSVDELARSGDRRVSWPLVDLLRFHEGSDTGTQVRAALEALMGIDPGDDEVAWVAFSNRLLSDEVAAPPGYLGWKRAVFTWWDDRWAPFFADDADLDWRQVTWGGVGRDAIEALVDPPTVAAGDATYLDGGETVFGVVVGGEARAYPLRHMEVHELVNDRLGDTAIAVPYCTLCGSAIGYRTGVAGGRLELRTSGLLQRSNKLMYDAGTESLFHQFTGRALTGPLLGQGVTLEPFTVATTTWAEWRAGHPDTTVLVEDAGTGRTYTGDLLAERDAGPDPLFPVGAVDERLPAKERVLGVETPDGAAVAFPVAAARRRLAAGDPVEAFGVELRLAAGGLAARAAGGPDLVAHEAFWFAWSQFRVDTRVWEP